MNDHDRRRRAKELHGRLLLAVERGDEAVAEIADTLILIHRDELWRELNCSSLTEYIKLYTEESRTTWYRRLKAAAINKEMRAQRARGAPDFSQRQAAAIDGLDPDTRAGFAALPAEKQMELIEAERAKYRDREDPPAKAPADSVAPILRLEKLIYQTTDALLKNGFDHEAETVRSVLPSVQARKMELST